VNRLYSAQVRWLTFSHTEISTGNHCLLTILTLQVTPSDHPDNETRHRHSPLQPIHAGHRAQAAEQQVKLLRVLRRGKSRCAPALNLSQRSGFLTHLLVTLVEIETSPTDVPRLYPFHTTLLSLFTGDHQRSLSRVRDSPAAD
jgi:hypothetical protein